jgi:secreted PhoX family phosphatase
MVGIPDGLGATKGPGNTTILFMNHELSNGSVSEPNVGGPLNRGAFVSRFILDKNACVVSGKRAYDTVHDEETGFVYPAAEKWAIPLRDSAASARDRSPSGKPASTAQSTSPMGAFGFIRIEDGAWSKTDKNKFYFVTTGSGTGNQLGNAYEVTFDKNNILATTKITQIYNGDAVAAAGGDIGFAPDNIDTSKDYLMV